MNQIIIEFKTPKELAKRIAEYNDLLNPKQEPSEAQIGISEEDIRKAFKEQAKPVVEEIVKEVSAKYAHTTAEDAEEKTNPTTEEYVTNASEELEQAIADVEAETAEEVKDEHVEEVTAEEVKEDITEPETPITDFDGNVVEPEELELAEPVEEVQPFDWKEFKNWLGENKGMTLKVKAVFDNHGATSYDSSALTDAIIADLQALRAEVQ